VTKKQIKILDSALFLFAHNGVDGTSTSSIAKSAKVSEGLIFRHFKSKEGLLQAILEQGKEMIFGYVSQVELIENHEDRLGTLITMPFELEEEHQVFWKLVYTLKWRSDKYDDTLSAPLRKIVARTFKALEYENPSMETEFFMLMMDGIMTTMLLRKPRRHRALKNNILEKYELL